MYTLRDFISNPQGDLLGGLTAAVVALPLALAFGIASGAGPIAGLYGAVFVGFFAAVFGGTRTQVSGPTGPMTVVMTGMTSHFVAQDPEHGLQIALATVVLAGLMQIGMGLLRLGKYIIMVPYPVISGFMSGIGAIIIILQLGPLLGYPGIGGIMQAASALPAQLAAPDVDALILAGITLGIVFLWRGRVHRVMPSPLLALVVGTAVLLLAMPDSQVQRIGAIPSALPSLSLPSLDSALLGDILINAVMLAVLGAIDSLLTSLVADNVTGTQHHSDNELVGQGIGNTIAGLFGGLPGAGATMRTMINIRAGGTGPLSGAIHSLVLFAVAGGLGFLFEDVPLVVLAGILVKVGIDIIDWPFVRRLHRLPLLTVSLTVLVFLLTVFVDLITAVFVGVFIKNMITIGQLSDLQLGDLVLSDGKIDAERLTDDERYFLSTRDQPTLVMRIEGPVSYALGRGLMKRFRRFTDYQTLLIDLRKVTLLGISTSVLLEDLIEEAKAHDARVVLIGGQGQALDELRRLGVVNLVGKDYCFDTMAEMQAANV